MLVRQWSPARIKHHSRVTQATQATRRSPTQRLQKADPTFQLQEKKRFFFLQNSDSKHWKTFEENLNQIVVNTLADNPFHG
jgi:hypothetical protein